MLTSPKAVTEIKTGIWRVYALLIGLVAFSFIGSYAVKHLLNRLPEPVFRVALKATLAVLALQLLISAVRASVG